MPQGPIAIRVLSEVMATSAHVKVVREFPGPLVGSASVSAVTSYLGNTSLLEEASRALGITDPMQDAVLLNHALQVWVGGGHVRRCSESSGRWGHLAVPFLMFLGGYTHLCVCVRVCAWLWFPSPLVAGMTGLFESVSPVCVCLCVYRRPCAGTVGLSLGTPPQS